MDQGYSSKLWCKPAHPLPFHFGGCHNVCSSAAHMITFKCKVLGSGSGRIQAESAQGLPSTHLQTPPPIPPFHLSTCLHSHLIANLPTSTTFMPFPQQHCWCIQHCGHPKYCHCASSACTSPSMLGSWEHGRWKLENKQLRKAIRTGVRRDEEVQGGL